MSDSEDNFASADEEVSGSDPKQQDVTKEKDRKKNQGLETDETSTKTKEKERIEQGKLENANNAATNDNDNDSSIETGVKDTSLSSSTTRKKSSNQKKGKQNGKKKTSSPSERTSVQKKSSGKTAIVNTEVDEAADVSEKSSVSSEKSTDDAVKDGHGIANSESSNTNNAGGNDGKVQGVITKKEAIEKADEMEEKKTPTMSEEVVNEKIEPDSVDLIKSPSTQSITRPGPDHTEEQENVLKKLAEAGTEKKQSGWGWGWGSSLLNVASSSVSTFTSQVGEGFNTMIETVESTLNVPSPEDLVAETKWQKEEDEKEEEEKVPEVRDSVQGDAKPENEGKISQDDDKSESPETSKAENQTSQESSNSWFSSWGVGNLTKMVESTGKTLVTGSLDVLETLGKKTFDALNEHDPGLKKTRGLLRERGDKPNLSLVLRDARDHHEKQVKLEKESEEARKAHFGTLFDDFQGLAHLEALEILSNQSEKKVNTLLMALSPDLMAALKPHLLEIKTNFEIVEEDEEDVDEHDFTQLLSDIFGQLNIGTSPDKLTRMQGRIRDMLKEFCEREDKPPAKEIHQTAIQSLAEFTAKCIEQFHKAGEMVLLHKAQHSDFLACSSQLHSLTKVVCAEVGILSTKFTECLNSNAEADDTTNINQLVTSVYLEASNSSSYIQDGFQLLLPVMQQAALEKKQEPVS